MQAGGSQCHHDPSRPRVIVCFHTYAQRVKGWLPQSKETKSQIAPRADVASALSPGQSVSMVLTMDLQDSKAVHVSLAARRNQWAFAHVHTHTHMSICFCSKDNSDHTAGGMASGRTSSAARQKAGVSVAGCSQGHMPHPSHHSARPAEPRRPCPGPGLSAQSSREPRGRRAATPARGRGCQPGQSR